MTEHVDQPILRHGRHLWQYRHPAAGSSYLVGEIALPSFDELRDYVAANPDDGSLVYYRWDWHQLPADPSPIDLEELAVHGLVVQTSARFVLTCPISKEQEQQVLDWLRGPRVLGVLRSLWTPLLDPSPAEVAEALELLHELVAIETAPCRVDHNGVCQEHDWIPDAAGETCGIARARSLLDGLGYQGTRR